MLQRGKVVVEDERRDGSDCQFSRMVGKQSTKKICANGTLAICCALLPDRPLNSGCDVDDDGVGV